MVADDYIASEDLEEANQFFSKLKRKVEDDMKEIVRDMEEIAKLDQIAVEYERGILSEETKNEVGPKQKYKWELREELTGTERRLIRAFKRQSNRIKEYFFDREEYKTAPDFYHPIIRLDDNLCEAIRMQAKIDLKTLKEVEELESIGEQDLANEEKEFVRETLIDGREIILDLEKVVQKILNKTEEAMEEGIAPSIDWEYYIDHLETTLENLEQERGRLERFMERNDISWE
jgi:hypothetical protein